MANKPTHITVHLKARLRWWFKPAMYLLLVAQVVIDADLSKTRLVAWLCHHAVVVSVTAVT